MVRLVVALVVWIVHWSSVDHVSDFMVLDDLDDASAVGGGVATHMSPEADSNASQYAKEAEETHAAQDGGSATAVVGVSVGVSVPTISVIATTGVDMHRGRAVAASTVSVPVSFIGFIGLVPLVARSASRIHDVRV